MVKTKKRFLRFLSGDTLIEVMFAVGIFGLVAIGTIELMNHGLLEAQKALEITMARQEIDAQAESIRFIANAYAAEGPIDTKTYTEIWEELTNRAYSYSDLITENPNFYTNYNGSEHSCAELYEKLPNNAFVINPRVLDPASVKDIINGTNSASISDLIMSQDLPVSDNNNLRQSSTYPRLLFGYSESQIEQKNLSDSDLSAENYIDNLYAAEGIWVTAVESENGIDCSHHEGGSFRPDYYDFYVRTCWDEPGGNGSSTIGSTIRVSNPDQARVMPDITTGESYIVDWHRVNNTDTSVGTCGVEPTEHMMVTPNQIIFRGYTAAATNEGVEHTVDANNGFEFTADINTSGIQTGSGGMLDISMGPIRMSLDQNGGSIYVRERAVADVGSQFNLKMTVTTTGHFEVLVNGEIVGVANESSHGNTTLSIYFSQGAVHCSSTVPQVYINNMSTITNIGQPSYDSIDYCGTQSRLNYTVAFDANGGSGTMPSTKYYLNEVGQLPKNTFTMTGYYFTGWNTEADGSGISYRDEDFVRNLTSAGGTITLYARWDEAYYQINFNANGGSGYMNSMTVRSGTTVNLPNNTFTRTDYHFAGWNTQSNGRGTSYSNREAVTDLAEANQTVTLYAQWAHDTYLVVFMPNGASGYTSKVQTINRGENTPLTFNTFFRSGYRFNGWNTKANGTGISYTDREVVYNLAKRDKSITLYAQWSNTGIWVDVNSVINGEFVNSGRTGFTFDVFIDGIQAADDVIDFYQPVSGGTTIRVIVNPKAGYVVSNSDMSYTVTGTLEINPTWTSAGYQIIFMANDGTQNHTVQYAPVNSAVNLTSNPFVRNSYTFRGWNTKANGTGTNYSNSQSVNNLAPRDSFIKLYAQWRSNGSSQTSTCTDLGYPTMQNWTNTLRNIGQTIQLCDSRNRAIYKVTLLRDNNVWMTENLRLDLSNFAENITAANTNNPTNAFMSIANQRPAAMDSGFSADSVESIKYSTANLNTYGIYYNWYTATAGHGISSKTSGNVDGDICPKGWHLPTGDTYGEFYELDRLVGQSSLTTAPINFSLAGYAGTKVYSVGTYGLYWSSTTINTEDAYSLYLYSGNVQPGTNNARRHFGYSVRCVMDKD